MSGTLYQGWLSHKGQDDKSFRHVYGVLKTTNNVEVQLHMFSAEQPRDRSTHVGGYRIGDETDLKDEKKDKSHTTFCMTTSRQRRDGKQVKVSATFKVESKDHCNVWKAYLLGIARGQVPRDLLDQIIPGQRMDIQQCIDTIWKNDSDSGIFDSQLGGSTGPPLPPRHHSPSNSDKGSNSDNSSLGNSLPRADVRAEHRFYSESYRNAETPSWFFNCSRDEAECALLNGRMYGASLIRPSASPDPTVSYSMSYRMGNKVHHLKIAKQCGMFVLPDVPGGREHTFGCLNDVISYCRDIDPAIVAMKTNNLVILGVASESPYDSFLPSKRGVPAVGRHIAAPPVAHIPPTDYGTEYDDVSLTDSVRHVIDHLDSAYELDEQIYNLPEDEEPLPPPPRKASVPGAPPPPPVSFEAALRQRFTMLQCSEDYEDLPYEDDDEVYDDGCSQVTSGGRGMTELQKALHARRNVIHDVEDYEHPELPRARGRCPSAPGTVHHKVATHATSAATTPRTRKQTSVSFEDELKSKLEDHFIYGTN